MRSFFSLSFLPCSLSNRLAANVLEQRWRSPVAQVGWKRVFSKADWQQHVWDERQGSPTPDQRGLSLPVSSFRWESRLWTWAQPGKSGLQRWPLSPLTLPGDLHIRSPWTQGQWPCLVEGGSCWRGPVWGEKRKRFQVQEKLLGEVT